MDTNIFTLNKTTYQDGKSINGLDSVVWVERYATAGECTLVGEPTEELLADLTDGTLVSHTDSKTIMMIETHQIDETKEGPAKVVFYGRTVEWIAMENRVVTLNAHETDAYDLNDMSVYPMEFNLPLGNAWDQAVILIDRFLESADYSLQERMPNIQVLALIAGNEPAQSTRVVNKLAYLSDAVTGLLSSVDAGIKIERCNPSHPTLIQFVIHNGVDRSAAVRFDYNSGDLESAKYLWSIKNSKNSAYVSNGNGTLKSLRAGVSGLDLRVMPIDASDWEPTPPWTLAHLKNVFVGRAYDEISKRKPVSPLFEAVITKNCRYEYGIDYNIGDMVYVIGNYGVSAKMRVVEYAKTIDAAGEFGVPTLAPIES